MRSKTDSPATDSLHPSLLFFFPSFRGGGAERVSITLANELARRGHPCRIAVVAGGGALESEVDGGVAVSDLGGTRVIRSIPRLVHLIARTRPDAILATPRHAGIAAIVAARIARTRARVVVREANTLENLARTGWRDRWMPFLMRKLYPSADGVVAVSGGVADDLIGRVGVEASKIHSINNPVPFERYWQLADDPIPAACRSVEAPLILAVGSLTRQKGFDSLLDAFALVLEKRPARLVVLGEGEQRQALERRAARLGIASSVALPGFVPNPFPCFARARIFTLSSRWEGQPNVLLQALAFGLPVVATDCRSGPREILRDGARGALVPVDDPAAMARAILLALDEPRKGNAEIARELAPFALTNVVNAYARVLLPTPMKARR